MDLTDVLQMLGVVNTQGVLWARLRNQATLC